MDSSRFQTLSASPWRKVGKLLAGWTGPTDAAFLKQCLFSGPEEVTKIPQGGGHGRLGLMVCLCFAFIQLEIMSGDRPGEPSVQPVPLLLVFFFRPLQRAGRTQR